VNQRFLLRIEQQGRVSYLAVQGQLNALHMAGAYARQTPAQQILVLDATGRVLWNSVPRDALLPVPPAVEIPSREKSMADEKQPGLDEQLFGPKLNPTADPDSPAVGKQSRKESA
jgi:hypothetical protein